MNDTPKRKRHWYQFSLRTMLVIVTLACVGFGYWVRWSKEWIRQRQEFMHSANRFCADPIMNGKPIKNPPLSVWVFGGDSFGTIWLLEGSQFSADEVRRLFPEARVIAHSE